MSDGIGISSGKRGAHASPFHHNILEGKVALVTGGGSGIGLQMALQLGLHGCGIAIMGRKQPKLDKAVAHLKSSGVTRVLAVQGDVRHKASGEHVVAEVLKHFGRLDVLVNNAAGNFLCLLEDLSLNAFKTVIDIDLVGTFNMSQCAREALRDGGCIINITATLHYGATPYVSHASVAKAGVDALTRSCAVEWRSKGIRVNGIAPGPIDDTEGMSRLAPKALRNTSARADAPVMGEKDDIAMAAVFLASPAAKYINGETLVVDGATWMHKPEMIPREFYEKNIKKRSKL